MFKIFRFNFLALIFLAGCAAPTVLPPRTGEPVAANWPAMLPQTNAATGNPVIRTNIFIVQTNLPPPIRTNPPVIVSKPIFQPSPPAETWISLSRWARQHDIGSPHLISDMPVATYAVGSSNGVMILEIGSANASWNGVEINLAFDPQLIDGEIFLHGLDLEKNLEPLLCAPPLSFSRTNRVIVIDPGHGGSNLGTHSVLDGRFEKEFTLDVAKRIKPLLETNGWTVFLTRTNDSYVTNANRVVFAATHHANFFISLHFNSGATDTKQAGLETYCFTPTGMPSTLTRGYADPWLEKLSSNDFDTQNLQLAVKLHGALLRATGAEDRGIRRARFIEVLRGQQCPAILIEAGYLSNPAEAKLIESADYRQKLAEAIADALK